MKRSKRLEPVHRLASERAAELARAYAVRRERLDRREVRRRLGVRRRFDRRRGRRHHQVLVFDQETQQIRIGALQEPGRELMQPTPPPTSSVWNHTPCRTSNDPSLAGNDLVRIRNPIRATANPATEVVTRGTVVILVDDVAKATRNDPIQSGTMRETPIR